MDSTPNIAEMSTEALREFAAALLGKLAEKDETIRVKQLKIDQLTAVKLATERKHLTDIIKMLAYQAESDLFNLLRSHYPQAEQEGRTLHHELFFAAAGNIHLTQDERNRVAKAA